MAIVALCRRLIAGSGFFPRSSGGTLCSVMQLVVLGVVLLLALSAPLIYGSASGGMGRPGGLPADRVSVPFIRDWYR